MLHHPFGTVGEGYIALKLRRQIYVAQLGLLWHMDFGALQLGILDVQPLLIDVRADSVDFVCRQKPIFNPLAKTVQIRWRLPGALRRIVGIEADFGLFRAKVGVGIDAFTLLGSCHHAKLDGFGEMLQDVVPLAKPGAMAFINNNQAKEVGGMRLKSGSPWSSASSAWERAKYRSR
jgi:hypothetical protein